MLNIKRKLLTEFIDKHVLEFSLSIILGIAANIILLIIPLCIGKMFELLFGMKHFKSELLSFLPEFIVSNVFNFLNFLLVLITLQFIIGYISRFKIKSLGEKFVNEIRIMLFSRQMSLKYDVYKEKGTGRYLFRYSGDLISLSNYLSKGVITFVIDLFLIIFAATWMFMLSGKIFLIVAFCSLFTYVIVNWLNKFLQKASRIKRNMKSRLLSYVSRHLKNIYTILAFNKQTPVSNKFSKISNYVLNKSINNHGYEAIIYQFLIFSQYITILAVFVYISFGNPDIPASYMISFVLVYLTLIPVFKRVYAVSSVYKIADISFNKINQLMNEEHEENLINSHEDIYTNEIVIYRNGEVVLRSRPGQINELDLNNEKRLHQVIDTLICIHKNDERYSVMFGDKTAESYSTKFIRKQIAIVSKRASLVGKTALEAITYSDKNSNYSKAKIILDEIQEGLSDDLKISLEQKLNDNNSSISNTQEDVLIIARALLTNKPVIVIEDFNVKNPVIRDYFLNKMTAMSVTKNIVWFKVKYKNSKIPK